MFVIIRVYIYIYSQFITQGWYEFGQYQSASCNNWATRPLFWKDRCSIFMLGK